jgi:hypothetical protein
MTDDEFLVLNSVYLRKIASRSAVAECSGLSTETVAAEVDRAAAAEHVFDVGDGMLMLSESGTQAILAEYRSRYGDLRASGEAEQWYGRFELLNGQFLTAISAWQQDGATEPGRLDKLLRLVERQVKALQSVAGQIPRYALYRTRFEQALDKVERGSSEYVVSPNVDSIHNIWFELHEDILTVLGRPRDVAEAST